MVTHQHLAFLQGWRVVPQQFEIAERCFRCGAVVEKDLRIAWQGAVSAEQSVGGELIGWQTSAGGVGVGALDVFKSTR